MTLIESLSYTPVELGFGTSGLRGLAKDMTDLECYINTCGFLTFLKNQDELNAGETIYLAGDLRESTPRILKAVTKAVLDQDLNVVYCGLIPTPALAYYAQEKNSACIMVTGSHIPADRNGIKFYKTNGEVLKEDESSIKRHVSEIRGAVYAQDYTNSPFGDNGLLNINLDLPALDQNAEQLFLDRYAPLGEPFKDRHVVVYQHSAVGRDLLVTLLETLGAHVTSVGRSDTFISIDTENVTPDNKDYFKSLARQFPDNLAIVSTDGDSDRPFVVDETGVFHRGDIVGCIVAQELHADFAAVPISANDAVTRYLQENDIELKSTRIGSPYVISGMNSAQDKNAIVGWEVNGGFMTGSVTNLLGVKLMPLPTRDAFLPILACLLSATKAGKRLSEVFKVMPSRYTGGALLDVDSKAADRIRELTKDLRSATTLAEHELVSDELGEPIGINNVDGLRVEFSTGTIVHIRPSGNAPQLRIYTNADSQELADKLALDATAPGGLLQRFVEAVVER